MQKTHKLYYEDPYMSEFSALLLSAEVDKDGLYDVILDRTAFFPEGGGQGADTGTIADSQVLDVQIHDDVITHKVRFDADPSILLGGSVRCKLDFERRFSNMQQHTGEHIFSGLVNKHYCLDNVGFHLSDNIVTMDYNGKLSEKDVVFLEKAANEAIFKNIPVKSYFPEEKELATLEYRSKLDPSQLKDLRIVEIEGIDTCACCAPHVDSTSQVGLLKVISTDSHKSGVRLTIICGMRALEDYRKKHETLLTMSHMLSVPFNELPQSIEKLNKVIESNTLAIRALEEKLLVFELEKADSIQPVIFCEISDSILLRNTVNSLIDKGSDSVFAFNGNDQAGYSFIIASKKDDAKEILHRLGNIIDIKGGGSSAMVQGKTTIPKLDIEEAVKRLN